MYITRSEDVFCAFYVRFIHVLYSGGVLILFLRVMFVGKNYKVTKQANICLKLTIQIKG